MLGTYIANPTYGTFKIIGFSSTNNQVTVLNECFAGNAAPGTVVPSYTSFVYSLPPALTTYTDWTPTLSGRGGLTVSAVTINQAEYFTIATTCFFNICADFTLGGVTDIAVYATLPFTGVADDVQTLYACSVEDNSGVELGAGWRVDTVDPSRLVVALTNASNWTLGTGGYFAIQGRFQVA